jgi:hypothetical protein
MDVADALAELTELSSQVEAAAILDGGRVAGTVGPGAEALASAAGPLLAAARAVRPDGPAVTRVEVALPEGGVVCVVEGARSAVARTVPGATAGLVVYDLRTCLRRLAGAPEGAGA